MLFEKDAGHLIVFENRGGFWKRDTIDVSWTPNENANLEIFAADRFFMTVEKRLDSVPDLPTCFPPPCDYEYNTRRPDEVYYYAKTDSGWTEHAIRDNLSGEEVQLYGPTLANDMFQFTLTDTATGKGTIYYGKHCGNGDTISIGRLCATDWCDGPLIATAGVNFAAWEAYETPPDPKFASWDTDGWTIDTVGHAPNEYDFRAMIPMRGGVAYETEDLQFGSANRIITVARTTSGWQRFDYDMFSDTGLITSGGSSYMYGSNDNTAIVWWDGTGFSSVYILTNHGSQEIMFRLSDEIAIANNDYNDNLHVKRYLGNNTWATTETLSENHWDHLVGMSRDIVSSAAYRKLYSWSGAKWDTLDLSGILPPTTLPADSFINPLIYYGHATTYRNARAYYDRAFFMQSTHTNGSFQRFDDRFMGKPIVPVLSRIKSYTYPSDPNPLIQTYSYEGAIMDVGISGLRFSKVTASKPYYANSSPTAFSIAQFYNDMDDDDSLLFGISDLPNLDDTTFYRVPGGGHLLDGAVYFNYDSSATDTEDSLLDYTKTQYKVFESNFGHYGTIVFSRPIAIEKRQRGIVNSVSYTYNNWGIKTEEATELYDSVRQYNTTSIADGFPVRQGSLVSKVHSGGETQYTGRSNKYWIDDNSKLWKVVSWADAANSEASYIDSGAVELGLYTSDSAGYPEVDSAIYFGPGFLWPWVTRCDYELEIKAIEEDEYVLIRKNGVTVDSLDSEGPINCKAPIIRNSSGSFSVTPDDTITLVLDNSHASGGLCWDAWTYCQADIGLWGVDTADMKESVDLMADTALGDWGFDEFNNLLSWTVRDGDTMSAKYSPDGLLKYASISNGFINECFFMDAEYDTGEDSLLGDGWKNRQITYGGVTSSQSFTGSYSYILRPPSGYFDNVIIDRGALSDSLMSNEYVADLWYKCFGTPSGGITVAMVGHYGVGAYSESETISNADTGWANVQILMNLGDIVDVLGGLDSVNIKIKAEDLYADSVLVDDIRFYPVDASVTTSTIEPITHLISSRSDIDNIPVKYEYDSFRRPSKTIDRVGHTLTAMSQSYSRIQHPAGYDPDYPNYAVETSYAESDSAVSVTYMDGFGRNLQTRTLVNYNGQNRTLVSGVSTTNANGQVLKEYLPFIDLVDSSGLFNYSDSTEVRGELAAYYDGTDDVDCDTTPYLEYDYTDDARSVLIESSQPGPLYSMASGNTTTYDVEPLFADADTFMVSTVTDPDDIVAKKTNQSRGKYSASISEFTRSGYGTDSASMLNYNDVMTQMRSVALDTSGIASTDEILLTKEYYDDMGQVDSTWKEDYGTIRMIYDNKGNKRFMQNDKRLAEDNFVYFKYDAQGRKIEEGILEDDLDSLGWPMFSRRYANMPEFPDASLSSPVKQAKYQWYYDNYNDSLVAPGKLVRVYSVLYGYYRNYYYYPESDSDFVVVHLTGDSTDLKGISHKYNRDGSLRELVVYPHLSDTSDYRRFVYEYDNLGRVKSVGRGESDGNVYLKYADQTFYGAGKLKNLSLGVFDSSGVTDLVQSIDYQYDTRGALTNINERSTVVSSIAGTGDHYAQEIVYDPAVYANGRIRKIGEVRSEGADTTYDTYQTQYDDRGWLTRWEKYRFLGGITRIEQYGYNALGNRTWMRAGFDPVGYYSYDADTGSSRLRWYTGMASTDSLYYDVLGNLIADSARGIDLITYDYRNMPTLINMPPWGDSSYNTGLVMEYDHTGRRIEKRFNYTYWGCCVDGGGQMAMPAGGGGVELAESFGGSYSLEGGGGVPSCDPPEYPCLKNDYSATYYLYDGDVLLATFDESDNVIDMYVNGPGGAVATYWQNSDTLLYYFIRDQLGSTRITMSGEPNTTHTMAAHYVYLPFGGLESSSASYDTPYKFTGKEHDLDHKFDYYYFGARFYDYRVGQFVTIDKASQFASGYLYGANNPLQTLDKDGNLAWFVPVIVGAVLGGYSGQQVAEARGASFWEGFGLTLGGAALGAYSAGVGAAISNSTSAILGSVYGSFINSTGMSIMTGGDINPSINFGIGNLDLVTGNTDWVDFKGDPLDIAGDVMGVMTVMQDLNKLLPNLAEQGYTYDEKTGNVVDKDGNVVTNISKEALEKAMANPGKHYAPNGTEIENPLDHPVPAKGEGISLRLSGGRGGNPGGVHLDIWNDGVDLQGLDVEGRIRFHLDAFASGSRNPGTALHHIIFESLGYTTGKFGAVPGAIGSAIQHASYGYYYGRVARQY